MCERAVPTNRPSLDLSPFVLEGQEPVGERGTDPVSSSTRTVAWVPGIGRTTSAALIAAMPELGQANNKIVAALLGVAPYDDDSGRRRGERHIKGGRRRTRNVFYRPWHMPQLLAVLQFEVDRRLHHQIIDRLERCGRQPGEGAKNRPVRSPLRGHQIRPIRLETTRPLPRLLDGSMP